MRKSVIHIDPIGKPRMTQRDKWAKRPAVMRYYAFKDTLSRLVLFNPSIRLSRPHRIVFCIEMPKSWSKRKKIQMQGQPHRQKPDIDNMLKAVYDSLLEDDSIVYSVQTEKYWDETGSITFYTEESIKDN